MIFIIPYLLIPWSTPRLIILVHDVSPIYIDEIREITAIISKYGFQNSTILLIIPNHAERHQISKDKEFTSLIRKLEAKGYKVGIHGYDHIGNEFQCNGEVAREKLMLAMKEFHEANITFERVFVPPRYRISKNALNVLLKENFTVYLKGKVCYPNGECKRVKMREYTWYVGKLRAKLMLLIAKLEYTHTRGVFILSVHPRAVNYGGGMEFLEEFLNYVKRKSLG
ncbi:DUF2334 domain-containing protein [Pyrococcus sp. NA2]|uniref:DUF2334 domain-containing protein n=1 Tax=Pyrococcus sp. (strain NA2) TaxID=342949 RepID=UPI000B257D50|nr:DUF2334 domain-containing protein [Pyrococcus sp. NA2]